MNTSSLVKLKIKKKQFAMKPTPTANDRTSARTLHRVIRIEQHSSNVHSEVKALKEIVRTQGIVISQLNERIEELHTMLSRTTSQAQGCSPPYSPTSPTPSPSPLPTMSINSPRYSPPPPPPPPQCPPRSHTSRTNRTSNFNF